MVFLTILFVTFITLLLLLHLYQNYSRAFHLIRKVPSWKPLPIFGHLFYLQSSPENIFNFVKESAQKFYPIFSVWALHFFTCFICSPEDAEIILTNSKNLKKGAMYSITHCWLKTGLLTGSGAKWHMRRKILTPAFHYSSFPKFINTFNQETSRIIDDIKGLVGQSVDIMPLVNQFTICNIGETAMGVDLHSDKDSVKYKQAVRDFSELFFYRANKPWLLNEVVINFFPIGFQFRRIVKILHEFSAKVIESRKKNFNKKKIEGNPKKMPLLDLLLLAKENGEKIDDAGIKEEVDTFMFAGHDTTAVALGYLFYELAKHLDIQEEIYNEIVTIVGATEQNPTVNDLQQLQFTERCIKEILRLYPSVPLISRCLDTDLELPSGYKIPAGCDLFVNIFAIHRNPKIYPDPEKFDPDRFLPENVKKRHPFAFIPFSAGPRNCIGQKFAMLQIKALLCGVLRKFKIFRAENSEEPIFAVDIILKNIKPMKVKFMKRGD